MPETSTAIGNEFFKILRLTVAGDILRRRAYDEREAPQRTDDDILSRFGADTKANIDSCLDEVGEMIVQYELEVDVGMETLKPCDTR
ncbi:hypothetical protein BURMUCGD2M_6343 [Burkholderia multivorans CGD2M]|uniref:Uncharacterized protein n=1 Tax=Burkholderia multivorans CGD2 TaxID=513052 RepID=B9BNT4_9BURK|nr:hypothetical protein BURMUCGD2_6354 [Burkholderia multivorans CGD2]EEE13622.1 hypothetical protein BURMUCGD2M_6343 [Burkholderia multivorans CGD2M]KUY59451.1 hypothetical protein WS45_08365 [Burkholderia sp. RF2-non_BP3]